MDAATANRLPPLGWPWDQMADAVLRWAAARDRHHAAVVAGAVNAREEAAREMWSAERDRAAVRDEVASQWLLGLRVALEEYGPAYVAELLGGLPPQPAVVEAILELEDRVDAAEDAIVGIEHEHGRVCR